MKKTNIERVCKLYPELSSIFKDNGFDIDRKYLLKNGIFFSIVSYQTEDKRKKNYESHKDYIDIQIVLEGKEIVSFKEIDVLSVCAPYDKNKDITLYFGDQKGDDIPVSKGDVLVIMPNDGHMPGLSIPANDKKCEVTKMVIKVPYRPNRKPQYLIMDVDGTLTDGKIYISPSGEIMKAFNIKDGCGIHDLLIPKGIIPVIITGRSSEVVLNRCKELGITEVYQGIGDKLMKLKELSSNLERIAYIGDDINDLPCMKAVKEAGGAVGCPHDAVEEVIQISDFVSKYNGGDGAVRDFIKWIN